MLFEILLYDIVLEPLFNWLFPCFRRVIIFSLFVTLPIIYVFKARLKRRTSHAPNKNRFCSLALDSAHVKFDA